MGQEPAKLTKMLAELRQKLDHHFDESELQTLCFDLGVAYQGLPGQSKVDKVRELVAYCERHGRTLELIEACRHARPKVNWATLPEVPQIPTLPGTSPVSPKAAQFFSKAVQAHIHGDLWEAKRYYEMTLIEDRFYPRAAEHLSQVVKEIAGEAPVGKETVVKLSTASRRPIIVAISVAVFAIALVAFAAFTANAYTASIMRATAVAQLNATSTARAGANATQTAMASRHTPTPTVTNTPSPTPTPPVVVSTTVTLQTWSGRYVTATDVTMTGTLKAKATQIGEQQKFTLLCLANGKAAFQISNRFVSARNDEGDRNWELRAEATERLAWEEFTLVNPDTQKELPCNQALEQLKQGEVNLAFQTYHEKDGKNRFVTAMGQDADWVLRAETTVLDKYEKFTAINLASTPTVIVDTMDSLANWSTFDDRPFITATAPSVINISSVQGMVNNAVRISYDLEPERYFVGISKVITPGLLSGTQGLKFRYKASGPSNTLELKLLYAPHDGKGEVFSFVQRETVGIDGWETFKQFYSMFDCGDTCTVPNQSLDPARVWKIDIAVSHRLGGTRGQGSVIVDQIEVIRSSPCTRGYGCSVMTMATVELGKSDRFCEETITLSPAVKASGFRIDMTQRALENYGYSLYEVEAYGPADTRKNLLIGGAQVDASSNKGDAPLVIDGRMLYSRWDSEHCCHTSCPKDKDGNMLCDNPKWADHQWLEITLHKPADIERIVLKWEQAYATEYCIVVTPAN